MIELDRQWEQMDIWTLEILHVRTDARYRVEYTPSRLDSEAPFMVVLTKPQYSTVGHELMEQIRATHFQQAEEGPYVRWGFVFQDKAGNRLHSLYIGWIGKTAYFDGQAVNLDSYQILKWVEEFLGPVLREH